MIKNFENKYCKFDKTIIVVGNYDKNDNNMKRKDKCDICHCILRYGQLNITEKYITTEIKTLCDIS